MQTSLQMRIESYIRLTLESGKTASHVNGASAYPIDCYLYQVRLASGHKATFGTPSEAARYLAARV